MCAKSIPTQKDVVWDADFACIEPGGLIRSRARYLYYVSFFYRDTGVPDLIGKKGETSLLGCIRKGNLIALSREVDVPDGHVNWQLNNVGVYHIESLLDAMQKKGVIPPSYYDVLCYIDIMMAFASSLGLVERWKYLENFILPLGDLMFSESRPRDSRRALSERKRNLKAFELSDVFQEIIREAACRTIFYEEIVGGRLAKS